MSPLARARGRAEQTEEPDVPVEPAEPEGYWRRAPAVCVLHVSGNQYMRVELDLEFGRNAEIRIMPDSIKPGLEHCAAVALNSMELRHSLLRRLPK